MLEWTVRRLARCDDDKEHPHDRGTERLPAPIPPSRAGVLDFRRRIDGSVHGLLSNNASTRWSETHGAEAPNFVVLADAGGQMVRLHMSGHGVRASRP